MHSKIQIHAYNSMLLFCLFWICLKQHLIFPVASFNKSQMNFIKFNVIPKNHWAKELWCEGITPSQKLDLWCILCSGHKAILATVSFLSTSISKDWIFFFFLLDSKRCENENESLDDQAEEMDKAGVICKIFCPNREMS